MCTSVCVFVCVCVCVCMHVHAISLCLVTKKMLPTAQWTDQENRFDSAPTLPRTKPPQNHRHAQVSELCKLVERLQSSGEIIVLDVPECGERARQCIETAAHPDMPIS